MAEKKKEKSQTGLEIAVIGMAGRFPGAIDIGSFWDNLKNGVESVTVFTDEELLAAGIPPETVNLPNYVKAKGYLEDIQYFDSAFFNYSPNEAKIMDPQVRLFHQCAWHSLEDAGYDPDSYKGLIGLYAGYTPNMFWKAGFLFQIGRGSEYLELKNLNSSYFATLINYKLNLKGPAVSLNTSCSTSLVAIHLACRALYTGEASIALAGGVSVSLPQKTGYIYEDGMIMSPDGRSRPFDAEAKGIASGNGAAVVVLKRLVKAVKDGDHIYAVIKGSAINNDGNRKPGYTAPSVTAQAEAIRAAQRMAGVEPETVTYVETHGTATPLGDPIEIEALKKAFGNTGKKRYCRLGFLKANTGHMDEAAGVGGFIKTVLALKHRLIPPAVNFETPNPAIDFENSPFYINTGPEEWHTGGFPLRAGVSSFGIGGTNAHVILEEWPSDDLKNKTASTKVFGGVGTFLQKGSDPPEAMKAENREVGFSSTPQLILLSAKTQTALEQMEQNLADYLNNNNNVPLTDIAYTLMVGRKAFSYRRMLVCRDKHEAVRALLPTDQGKTRHYFAEVHNRPVVFMFPGLGTQYINMGVELYHSEPVFRGTMDSCFEILESSGFSIKETLYPEQNSSNSSAANIFDFETAQAVIFIFEYALARLIMSWGIKPHALIGYSFGEYVAACTAGVFSLEDALTLVCVRGKLIRSLPAGAMLSVPADKETVKPFLNDRLTIAIDNGDSCVIAGPGDAVAGFENQMKKKRYLCMNLQASRALHTPIMESITEEFVNQLRLLTLNKPQIPFISNVTGTWINPEDAVDPAYWAAHLKETVRFSDGLKELMNIDNALFLEVGPGVTISTLAYQYMRKEANHAVVNLMKSAEQKISDVEYLLKKIGTLWLYGVKIDWAPLYGENKRKRVPLPLYPFDKLYYSIDDPMQKLIKMMEQQGEAKSEQSPPLSPAANPVHIPPEEKNASVHPVKNADKAERILARMWEELLGINPINIFDNLLEMGVTSLKGITFVNRLKEEWGVEIDLTVIFDAPTTAELAAYIRKYYPEGYAQLTGEQPGDKKNIKDTVKDRQAPHAVEVFDNMWKLNNAPQAAGNIFFIHEITGYAAVYAEFCRQLGTGFNCWGIQADRLKNHAPQNWTLKKIAAGYIRKIKKVQPGGPYYLSGWSFAGNILFEMTWQLEQMGETPALLAFIDCAGPHCLYSDDPEAFPDGAGNFTLKTEKNYIKETLSGTGIETKLAGITAVNRLWPLVVDYLSSNKLYQDELNKWVRENDVFTMIKILNRGEFRVEHAVRYQNLARSLKHAVANYKIPGKINTPLHYFEAIQGKRDAPEHWSDYCSSPVIYHQVYADHYSILRQPKVVEFARIFNEVLKKIDSKVKKSPEKSR